MPAAELRRQRAAFRRGVLRAAAIGTAVLVLLFGLTFFALRQPSLNLRQQLPDGTILTLERVTYGKEHVFRHVGFQWPWPLPFILNFVGIPTPNDGLAVWFSRRDPATGKSLKANPWVVKPVDQHGCIFGYTGSAGPFNIGPQNLQTFSLSSFPRRQERFKLVLYDPSGKHVTDVMVPVPKAARGPFENLLPEPLPVTKRDGELTFTLANLTAQSSQGTINQVPMEGFYFVPEFRITANGQPSDAWSAENIIASDATGNLTEGNARFCLYEPALKFRVKFFRNERAHFATNDETWMERTVVIPLEGAGTPTTWTVRHVAIPREGAITPLDGPPNVRAVRIDMLAMGGAGTVTYTNAAEPVFVGTSAAFGTSSWSYVGAQGDRLVHSGTSADFGTGTWSGFFEGGEYHVKATRSAAGAPAVVTVKAAVPHLRARFSGLGEDQRVTVIATDEQGRPVKLAREVGGGLDNMWCWFMKLPPEAKIIDVTFALHHGRIAEFVVRPPLPPKQPDPK